MSASESSPSASNLQESIEQLIAETVRRSQSVHEAEAQQLRGTLRSVAAEVESAHAAMSKALEILNTALASDNGLASEDTPATDTIRDVVEPLEVAEEIQQIPAVVTEPEVGPHRMDLIAHDVTFGIATSLQSMLRGRPEVKAAHTREFVNGELRLDLDMESMLDLSVLSGWVSEHGGRIANQTSSVLELRFEG